ncbi:MAG: bacillithiol biosynthesis cysteine-adding enzyme BshC [Bacteroidia bacterium]|nr:bacillithiol biosynthesis cysteine-adding enzyme BshC [Bacteroidia bacterium]
MPSLGAYPLLSYMPSLPGLTAAYLKGDRTISGLFPSTGSMAQWKEIASRCRLPAEVRETLVRVIREQYRGLPVSHATEKNISLLESDSTYTVCTGHQCCLFSGPLYLPGKLLNLLRLAAHLRENALSVVPVFWMHTEDHDVAEIDHVYIGDKEIRWENSGTGPAGKIALHSIDNVIREVEALCGPSVGEILKRHYTDGRSLGDATRSFINELFGDFGLIILDPADSRLKSYFREQFRKEITGGQVYRSLSETNSRLRQLGYEPAVNPREINIFYMKPASRERLRREGERFHAGDVSWTEQELLNELEKNPERFSPNVALRAVYQQHILPNIAYIGGPGEVAYWLQFGELLKSFECNIPALILRNSFFLLSEKQLGHVRAAGLEAADLLRPLDDLIRRKMDTPDLSSYRKALEKLMEEVALLAGTADATLKASVAAETVKMQKSLDQIEGRMLRALKQKEEVTVNRLRSLKESLFPGGVPMERRENFLPYFSAYHPAFFGTLMGYFEPVPEHCLFISLTSLK